MRRSRKTAVLIPVIASFVLSVTTAGFAEPVQNPAETQESAKAQTPAKKDSGEITLLVVRSKENPSDIRLVDSRPAQSAPVQTAPVDAPPVEQKQEPVAAPQPAVKSEIRPSMIQVAPKVQQQAPAHTTAQPKTQIKPVAKPAPKPAFSSQPVKRKPVYAPKPKSPAPKSAVRKAHPAPKRKIAVAPKPNRQKQGVISRVVKGAASLASRALSWIGTRYIWGGFSSAGVDCSGLTSLIYKSVGVKLPHNARQQFKLGRPVAKSSLAPGDLVFFNTSGPISHVGIYIGNNKFVHAANKRRGVRTDSLGSSYYHKRYAGARRYI